jgi:anhydro-N-acetylmuramic acid kinase
MTELYIGMISGTSVDGADAALVELDERECRIVAAATTPYPPELHRRVVRLIENPTTSLAELGAVDHAVGEFFAACALSILADASVAARQVRAIGHHGQTVFHQPRAPEPFSMQIGDPNVVAALTAITTVADFRRLDMAHGGQGAPLVPAFHAWRFAAPREQRVVLNIGGIANITILDPDRPTTGFDTGPGNTLLDLWTRRHRAASFDADGQWAASGHVDDALLDRMSSDPYFAAAPPKSTGRELFHADWLDRQLAARGALDAADVQATLSELTARTIAEAIERAAPECSAVIVCGGGAYNANLLARLRRRTTATVQTSDAYGLSPDWVEAAAFAWLARARMHGIPGNVPSVTGAHSPVILGGVYSGSAP